LARDAHRSNINPDLIFDLVFWAVISGIAGARAFYIVLNYPFFMKHPNEIIMIQNGGLAWQGALILGSITVMFFIQSKKLPFSQILDICVPYLALGQSLGRIGCFLNGCCYGRQWAEGIYFPVHEAYLHPTQLYLSVGYLIIFVILKQYQRISQLPGMVFVSYLILAASLRFGVEYFRADHEILFLGLSIFQFVCFGVLLFAFGFAYLILIKNSNPHDM
jgi:phosphatidylglycerol:prolipoprotein diacylglycerol transferase